MSSTDPQVKVPKSIRMEPDEWSRVDELAQLLDDVVRGGRSYSYGAGQGRGDVVRLALAHLELTLSRGAADLVALREGRPVDPDAGSVGPFDSSDYWSRRKPREQARHVDERITQMQVLAARSTPPGPTP